MLGRQQDVDGVALDHEQHGGCPGEVDEAYPFRKGHIPYYNRIQRPFGPRVRLTRGPAAWWCTGGEGLYSVRMTRVNAAALGFSLMAACSTIVIGQGRPAAVAPAELAGTWTINRELSQFPRDIGFGMDVVPAGRSVDSGGIADEGRSGNPRSLTSRPLTEAEARNSRQILDEVRTPPARLVIAQSAAAVTMTLPGGRVRTFHTDGRDEAQTLDAGPLITSARWDGGRLVVRYKVEPGREVRYAYARTDDPPQLVVSAELIERGGHDTVVRVYEPAKAGDAGAPERPATPAVPALPMLPSQRASAAQPPAGATDPGQALVPVSPVPPAGGPLDQRPGAELIGLSTLGVVVEEMGPDAAKCGLKREAIESAVSNSLRAAGLRVSRNADDDTYVYVHVMTTAMSTGFCFSRYDAYVYSNTTAALTHGTRPVLLQASLLHKGGLTGSGAGSHGETVVRTLTQYVDQFAARIRDVNK
jgi:hypothetical protein